MRLSLFRSKSNTSSPSPSSNKKPHRFTQMLSPSRSNNDQSDLSASSALSSIDSRSPAASTPTNPNIASVDGGTPSDHFDPTTTAEPPLDHQSTPTSNDVKSSVAIAPQAQPNSNDGDDGTIDQSTLHERAMTQKLMEVESSFLPDPPLATGPPDLDGARASHLSVPTTTHSGARQLSQNTNLVPSNARSSAQDLHDSEEDPASSMQSSSLHHGLSSPAAAAAQRSKLRASSGSVRAKRDLESGEARSRSPATEPIPSEEETTPKQPLSTTQSISNPRLVSDSTRVSSIRSQNRSFDRASHPYSRPSRRPYYLQNHQSSQRASKDSFMSQHSDLAAGPDTEGPSGGATPGTHTRASRELSRVPSFGSFASSISGDDAPGKSKAIKSTSKSAPRSWRKSFEQRTGAGDDNLQQTPRASANDSNAPTDTVLAQHVRDVEVPDTVAREYRAAHSLDTPRKQGANSTPFFSRGKQELSLKEQNGKIDKLTKENFDLKLKIHFLHQALQDRSDEGVSDLMSQNVHLQADLVKLKKDNQSLKRRLRELQGKSKGWDNASASNQMSTEASEDDSSRSHLRAQYEDEIQHLRDQVLALQDDNARLIRSGQPEWDSLDNEARRRQEAERKVLELQRQLDSLRGTGDRNTTLRSRASNSSLTWDQSKSIVGQTISEEHQDAASLSGSTLVEQLRLENITLKRDLGVQTDMLSSRNRERERLQQEIEDLKLVQRRMDQTASTAGDSIADRSVSRSQHRPPSRASGSPQATFNDQERDQLETAQANLRDELAALKMKNQDLQAELNTLGDGAEHIRTLQTERDDAIRELRKADANIDYFYQELGQAEELVLERERDIEILEQALHDREEEARNFRRELKSISENFDALGDDREATQATIQSLQQDVANANGELEMMENNLRDLTITKEKLEVQQESAQSEIAFLREEQESDKIKIGDLQSALQSAKSNLENEENKLQRFEALEEQASKAREEARELRKAVSTKEAEARQHYVNHEELKTTFNDATRHFEETKKKLLDDIESIQRESEKKSKALEQAELDFDETERVLQDREALLELSGDENRRLEDLLERERQGRKHDRNEYERTMRSSRGTPEARIWELENTNTKHKRSLADLQSRFDGQIKSRDDILLSLWNRLSELCTTEKLAVPESSTQTLDSLSENLTAFDHGLTGIIEAIEQHVSGSRAQIADTEQTLRRDYHALEEHFKERSSRLSDLEQNFEQLLKSQIERDTDDVATTEYLNRLKQENRLLKRELRYLKQGSFALPGLYSPQDESQRFFREAPPTSAHEGLSRSEDPSGSPAVPPTKKRNSVSSRGSTLTRTHSANDTDPRSRHNARNADTEPSIFDDQEDEVKAPQRSVSAITTIHNPPPDTADQPQSGTQGTRGGDSNDQRWVLRLEELKRRLRAEREGRLLDRDGARKRLEQGKRETDALKEELKREKVRASAAGPSGQADG